MTKEIRQPIGPDVSGGYEILQQAVGEMLNAFPGLDKDLEEEVLFETLEEQRGIAFSDDSGALIYNETTDVTGGVTQECRYPFYLVYRRNTQKERDKIVAHQFLDIFGRWLCKELTFFEWNKPPIEYPKLTGDRKITKVRRENIYATDPTKDGTQDWVLPVIVEYTSRFEED